MPFFLKTAVFPGGYGLIGEIPHGRIWPDRVKDMILLWVWLFSFIHNVFLFQDKAMSTSVVT